MNKIFESVQAQLDKACATMDTRHKLQREELDRYEADAVTADEAASKCLAEGNMKGFQEQNRKAMENRAAADKLKQFIENDDQPALTEEEYKRIYNMVDEVLKKENEKYTGAIYNHLMESRRLAEELFQKLEEGRFLIERLQFYGRGQAAFFNIRYYYVPDIQHFIADIRKLGFIHMYQEVHKK